MGDIETTPMETALSETSPTEKALSETTPKEEALASMGPGLLGFAKRPLGADVFAYYKAMGLSEEHVREVANELREGISPMTRSPIL